MRVTGDQINANSASSRMRPFVRETATAKAEETTSSSRALIPLSPVRHTERTQTVVRQPANFLAHLIATEQAIPQTRERRRVEAHVAAAIYAAAREIVDDESGHALSRAM
jgi:hypothetical protein